MPVISRAGRFSFEQVRENNVFAGREADHDRFFARMIVELVRFAVFEACEANSSPVFRRNIVNFHKSRAGEKRDSFAF